MATDEYSSYQTSPSVDQICRTRRSAFAGAEVSPPQVEILDDAPALAVLIERFAAR